MTSTHPKIIIRHIEARRSERVAWLLEELGISDYELDYIRGDVLGSLVELEKYHEMRMAPIVSFGDEVTMIESAAILEYILSRSDLGKGSSFRVGDDEPSYPAYLEFLHFAEGTAMPKIQIDVTENRARKMIKELGHEPPHIGLPKLPGNAGQRSGSQRILHYAESVLSKRKFFGGDRFTAADIMMHFPIKLGAAVASSDDYSVRSIQNWNQTYLENLPNVKDWLVRMSERPAFQRAMKTTMPDGAPAI